MTPDRTRSDDAQTQDEARAKRRRALNQWGSDDYIDGLTVDITTGDVKLGAIALLVAFGTYALATEFLPGWGWPVAAALAICPLLVVATVMFIARDDAVGPRQWVTDRITFHRSDHELSSVAADPDQRADTITQVSRFHPESAAVERTDGDFVGGGEIDPIPMSLADREQWEQTADAFGRALNTLDFPIMFQTTGRQVDPESITAGYEVRRDDPDVQANPALAEIIDLYARHWPSELTARKTALREYYVMTPATRRDVQMDRRGALGTLRELPYVGELFEALAGETVDMSDDEIRAEQADRLTTQLDAAKKAVESVEGASFDRLDADALARTLEEHWRGKRTEHDRADADTPSRIRTVPVASAGERADGTVIGSDADDGEAVADGGTAADAGGDEV